MLAFIVDLGFLSHSVPGRVRVKIPGRRGDEPYFSDLQARLRECRDVMSAQANFRAASILIVYGSEGGLRAIAEFARKQDLFVLESEQQRPAKSLPEIISTQLSETERLLGSLSGGPVHLQSLFFQLFVGLGLSQLKRGLLLPPAIPVLWRVVELMREMNKPGT